MKKLNNLLISTAILLTHGCSWMIPYEDEFACKKPNSLGKCVSTQEAYEEITTGVPSGRYLKPHSEQSDDEDISSETYRNMGNKLSKSEYTESRYREIAGLLKQEVTPIIAPTKSAEVLILPYSDRPNVLKGERVINVILEKPKFVLGDYLKRKPLEIGTMFN